MNQQSSHPTSVSSKQTKTQPTHIKMPGAAVLLIITSEVSVKQTLALQADPNPKCFSIFIDICMRAEGTRPLLSPLRHEK